MKLLYVILFCGAFFASCMQEEDLTDNQSQAKYTYGVESWESLGGQTLVVVDAKNPSHMDQSIQLIVEVVNKDGKVFKKDTTIEFSAEESDKKFQMMVDTEGEIEDVNITSKEL